MRQGPYYSQWIIRSNKEQSLIQLPLELEEEWKIFSTVRWEDNGDGTYTLFPYGE